MVRCNGDLNNLCRNELSEMFGIPLKPLVVISDLISNPNDQSAVLGVDNPLESTNMDSGSSNQETQNSSTSTKMQNTRLKVMDGIVNGTKVL
jgi:hypothetical protein